VHKIVTKANSTSALSAKFTVTSRQLLSNYSSDVSSDTERLRTTVLRPTMNLSCQHLAEAIGQHLQSVGWRRTVTAAP
jgi:hypothetical protein